MSKEYSRNDVLFKGEKYSFVGKIGCQAPKKTHLNAGIIAWVLED
jgi:hypothetical protein